MQFNQYSSCRRGLTALLAATQICSYIIFLKYTVEVQTRQAESVPSNNLSSIESAPQPLISSPNQLLEQLHSVKSVVHHKTNGLQSPSKSGTQNAKLMIGLETSV